jgi:hypothetical protein
MKASAYSIINFLSLNRSPYYSPLTQPEDTETHSIFPLRTNRKPPGRGEKAENFQKMLSCKIEMTQRKIDNRGVGESSVFVCGWWWDFRKRRRA